MKRQLVAAVVALPLLSAAAVLFPARAIPASDGRPNILIIVTDDQRQGLKYMPATRKWIVKGGTKFEDGFVTTPLCCPSRSSIMSGRYTHNHGVYDNQEGGNLAQRSTLQYYLQQAGYETAIYGKYLNSWDLSQPPPYFDKYAITNLSRDYKGADWNVNGTVKTISEYNTTYVANRAVNFIRNTGSQSPPWFLYLATAAPHRPFTPQKKYKQAPVSNWNGDPGVFEVNRSDKPAYVQDATATLSYGQKTRREQFRTLMSIDDLVSRISNTLTELGESRNTLVLFISDNSIMWGEHGLKHKEVPYEQAIHVPLMARWPGHFLQDAKDDRLVANIDLAPTVLEATGITPDPAYPIDGRSLLGTSSHRTRLLTENFSPGQWHLWASTRTKTYKYTEYYEPDGTTVKFREYYNLRTDPWELHNLLGDSNPDNDPDVAALSAHLAADRACQGTTGANGCP